MLRIVFSVLLFHISLYSSACSCGTTSQKKEFDAYSTKHVFVAEFYVLDTLETYPKKGVAEITQVFKGSMAIDTLIMIDIDYECPPIVGIDGQWLLFGHFWGSAKMFHVNYCGNSRLISETEIEAFKKEVLTNN